MKFEQDSHQLQESFRKTSQTTKQQYDEVWSNLIRTWTEGLARVGGLAGEVNEESARRFLDWDQTALDQWKPPAEVPPALPFGTFKIDLSDFPSGVPVDPRLKDAGPTQLQLPALVPFPIQASVLIKTADAGKGEAVKLLQALMLRFLTSVPPGKVRFTIFDPVGLGENFAAFMHLADYHELLVTSRIWTETPHIEQRLTDLTEHMENVIQKYLRNEFETIEEYNAYGRRGGRAVPGAGRGQFPDQLQRGGRPKADEHRQQRGAVRRLRLDLAGHQAAAARRAASSRTSSRTA